MSETCSNDCSNCTANCDSRDSAHSFTPTHKANRIRKVIGVLSGKGGVGKSLVTSLLAVRSRRKGYQTAILDADITGPSIPKAFGLDTQALGSREGIYPVESKTGIRVMSLNLLTDDATNPVVWRGPVISGAVKQFWTDVLWGDVDIMFIDMPPGTGDVALTVFQTLPLDGIIIVSTPQELVGMIVEKAVKMAGMMQIPILGLVENMSYGLCPHCGERIEVFGESRVEEIANKYGIQHVSRIPINPGLTQKVDSGSVEDVEEDWLNSLDEVIF